MSDVTRDKFLKLAQLEDDAEGSVFISIRTVSEAEFVSLYGLQHKALVEITMPITTETLLEKEDEI